MECSIVPRSKLFGMRCVASSPDADRWLRRIGEWNARHPGSSRNVDLDSRGCHLRSRAGRRLVGSSQLLSLHRGSRVQGPVCGAWELRGTRRWRWWRRAIRWSDNDPGQNSAFGSWRPVKFPEAEALEQTVGRFLHQYISQRSDHSSAVLGTGNQEGALPSF